MTINFYLNFLKNKDPEKIIYAYIRGFGKGKTIVLHTGERINPKFWNTEKQIVKTSYNGSPELNSYLSSFKEEIKKTIRVLLTEDPEAGFDEIKTALMKRFKKEKTINDFFEVFKLFIELRTTELSHSMLNKYKTIRNHLLTFEKETNYKVSFNSIDMMFFNRFSNYLLNNMKQTNNTVSKYFDLIKTFLNWSTDRKINTNLDFKKFKVAEEKVDIIYLTEKELLTLFEFDLKDRPALENVRDVFCFACFTGVRFSDVFNIKRENITGKFWNLRVAKTKDVLKIPLNEYAIEILNKYSKDNRPLPVISGQKTNIHIKEICNLADIIEPIICVKYRGSQKIEKTFPKYELVTTHTARRTFVTLSLEKGMRAETVMEITGHKDYATFKKYIKISSNVKQVEMNKIWKKGPNKNLKK